jgi:hypothetical protein
MNVQLSQMLVAILGAIIIYSMLVMFLLSIIFRELRSLSATILSTLNKSKNNDKPFDESGDGIKDDGS